MEYSSPGMEPTIIAIASLLHGKLCIGIDLKVVVFLPFGHSHIGGVCNYHDVWFPTLLSQHNNYKLLSDLIIGSIMVAIMNGSSGRAHGNTLLLSGHDYLIAVLK